MNKWSIIIISFIVLLILCFVAFSAWWWFIRNKNDVPICTAVQKGTMCLSNGFLAAVEKTQDDSMPTPLTSLKLMSFDQGQNYPPWCIPSFYAIRYVDEDGNYGGLSSWYGPVVAKPTANPGGCSANLPNLIVSNTADPNLGKYYINVHRQDSVLDQNSDGKVMGMLESKVYQFIDDPNSNPNIDGKIIKCTGYGCDS